MLGGVVLCGGQSRRMGRPKAWLRFGREFLLQRVVRIVGEAAAPIVVVAAEDQKLPELAPSVLVVRDPVPDLGPLQAIAIGLAALPNEAELVFVTATDLPFLRPEVIGRLVELIGEHDAAVPEIDGRLQPVAAVYRRIPTLPSSLGCLVSGESSLKALLARMQTLGINAANLGDLDCSNRTFRNLNTFEEYENALREAGFDLDG